jgi:hypothetical protein
MRPIKYSEMKRKDLSTMLIVKVDSLVLEEGILDDLEGSEVSVVLMV